MIRTILVSLLAGPVASLVAQTDNGRALDANLQVGPSRENPEVYQFVPTPADLVITGNVTGGRSFRGYSPLTHPNTLRIGIPSAALSDFRRDSFGLSGGYSGGPLDYGVPYFAPERNAAGNLDAFRTSPVGRRGDAFSSFNLQRSDLGNSLAVPLDFNATSLLNRSRPDSLQLSVPYMPTLEALDYSSTALKNAESERSPEADLGAVSRLRLPLDELATRGRQSISPTRDDEPLRLPPLPGGLTETVDISQPVSAPSLMDPAKSPDGVSTSFDETGLTSLNEAAAVTDRAGDLSVGNGLVTSLPQQTGHPYADFQSALAWISGVEDAIPGASDLEDRAIEDSPSSMVGSYERAVELIESRLTSFAGDVPTLAADYIRQAETLLKNGEFGRSAGMFRLAATLEPNNPLIDLGLGHALIGSGDFRSAFLSLTRGISRFPGFEYFQIDLSVFLTDPTLLDRRRAELERALNSFEDYELRFLLGYTEYFSGLPQFGMENLKKAALSAPADSLVRQVPVMLSKQPFWKTGRKR